MWAHAEISFSEFFSMRLLYSMNCSAKATLSAGDEQEANC